MSRMYGYHMKKCEVEKMFRESIMPGVRQDHEADGKPNNAARRKAWKDLVEWLARYDDIRKKDVKNWVYPRICGDDTSDAKA